MNDDAIFLTFRVGCIAGKPPPTKRVQSADYVLFDKRRLAGDLSGTGSKARTCGVSDAIKDRCASRFCQRHLR